MLAGVLFLSSFCLLSAQQEVKYQFTSVRDLTVLGQSANVQQATFHRVDSASQEKLPARVAELSRNSAGINILFQTNAKNIRVRWVLGKYNSLWNMTPLGVNGLDLYGFNGKTWQYVSSARPQADSNDAVVITGLDGAMRHYRLYLPLYSEAKEVEIGIDSGAVIRKAGTQYMPRKKVVIYGSSITQGASASRPGMAYPSILSRHLNIETFNMGFSGAGKMELPVADVLAGMEADIYVLDCVPNPSPREIKERAIPFIKRLRSLKPGVPIVMVESIYRETAYWNDQARAKVTGQNKAFREAYEQLVAEHYKNLYYIPAAGLTGSDHEATIDGTHLTDLGFVRLASRIEAVLVKVFKKQRDL